MKYQKFKLKKKKEKKKGLSYFPLQEKRDKLSFDPIVKNQES